MSGIFKSIKKVFKKVGKVIKKIAPYLIIAAGVYFGGSYLMSTYGGAGSAAAGSAATSFTKSAGVWKSFLRRHLQKVLIRLLNLLSPYPCLVRLPLELLR